MVANTWLGMAMNRKTGAPLFARRVAGFPVRLFSPLALRLVFQTAQAVRIPIVGCGGISCAQDVVDMFCLRVWECGDDWDSTVPKLESF